MSRAFVKEPESGAPGEPLPPRRISEHPNLVTPEGLRQLRAEHERLTGRRAELLARGDDAAALDELRYVDRDLQYVEARLASALPVDPSGQPHDVVAFGAAVTVREAAEPVSAASRTYLIVGEDEADAEAGKVSHVSPLARALLGARRGETVIWKRPIGDLALTLEAITYSA